MGTIIRTEQLATKEDAAIKYLTFNLAAEVYAIEVLRIKKVIEYSEVTHLPMAPAHVRGILNLLGAVIPVVDLLICFGEKSTESTRRTCIIIVEVEKDNGEMLDIGIVVDTVNNVVEFQRKDIAPAPDLGNGVRTRFMRGVAKTDQRFVVLLNPNYILSFSQLQSLERITAPAEFLPNPQDTLPESRPI